MEQESWKWISGYEGIYKISNYGRVYSTYYDRILNPRVGKNGYKQAFLCKEKIKTPYYIHRLVAEHFIENNDLSKKVINHKNEIKTDNYYDNLEWCTYSYNNYYNGKMKWCYKALEQLDVNYNLIRTWENARMASEELGIQYKNISAVARGKRNFCGGFRWRFKDE